MIDIIITYFNQPSYLDECLGSISKQTYRNFLIYIVDDCSTESPELVISKWKTTLNITYFESKENLGSLKQTERIYNNTNSPFVILMHHDDIWDELFLEKVFFHGLLQEEQCSFAYSLYSTVKEGSLEAFTDHLVPFFPTGSYDLLFHIIYSNWIQHSFAIFRRSSFNKVGGVSRSIKAMPEGVGYDKRRLLASDSYTWARLSIAGNCFVVNERLGVRRLHKKSYGFLTNERHLEEVTMFNIRVFNDFDLFDDIARYFSMGTVISRIFQKRRLFDVIDEMFTASLFSEPEFFSENFHSLKPKLLSTVIQVLDSFYYDYSKFDGRKLLKESDKVAYLNRISDSISS
jgi:glycosyltransferase involved in cell wall biosynthesis